MCEETLLGFRVSRTENFSNATTFSVINKYCNGAAIHIATVFRHIFLVLSLRVLSKTAF